VPNATKAIDVHAISEARPFMLSTKTVQNQSSLADREDTTSVRIGKTRP
jgi:hypothetical protein